MARVGLVEDLAVAGAAGYLGTKAMEPVSQKLYELASDQDRRREDAARPGPPYRIAAKKVPGPARAAPHRQAARPGSDGVPLRARGVMGAAAPPRRAPPAPGRPRHRSGQ